MRWVLYRYMCERSDNEHDPKARKMKTNSKVLTLISKINEIYEDEG